MTAVPAYVRTSRMDIVAANELCRALYGGALDDDRLPLNLARYLFLDPHSRGFFLDWDDVADDLVGALRVQAGRDPRDKGLSDLIGELSTRSDEFVARWARQNVRLHRTARKRLHNRVVGDIELTGNALELPGDDLVLIAYTADPGSPAEDQLRLLATLGRHPDHRRDGPTSGQSADPARLTSTDSSYRPPTSANDREKRDCTMPDVSTLTLNNGVTLPALGLGVFQTPPDETRAAVTAALEAGYRHIDTAAAYGNERQVGEAIAASGVDRAEVFVETKIWISDYGYDQTLHGFEKSARKLGVDQIDLLILHQALPSEFDDDPGGVPGAGDAARRRQGPRDRGQQLHGRPPHHACSTRPRVVPAVNQIEVHPYFQQREVQALGAEHGILTQAWSPIGGITFYRDGEHTSTLQDPVIGGIAEAHGKTPAQVMLRWGVQQGRSVIPKSTKPARIAENLDVFDFDLTADELAAIDALDTGQRGGPEPEAITLEAFGRPIPED